MQLIAPSIAVCTVQTCLPETVMCLFDVTSKSQKQVPCVYVVLSTNTNVLCTQPQDLYKQCYEDVLFVLAA